MNDYLRPSDQDAVHAQLRSLSHKTPFSVMFGGIVRDRDLILSGFVGTRSQILRGLTIRTECGAGGRALVELKPISVRKYSTARYITHEYDYQVGAEGIETLVAVPVVVHGRARGAMYGGLRFDADLGGRDVGSLVSGAAELAREFEIRDEVDNRMRMLAASTTDTASDRSRPLRVSEAITESYLALNEIAYRTSDKTLGAEIMAVGSKLREASSQSNKCTIVLSRRESDVLSYAALGCGNAEIAERLSLSIETIKSYMRNLMAKLEARNRHEAVVEARRQGLLP